VSLLARYLLRQLVAPFCFALAALTSLMLLNQVAKRFGALIGKGLPWSVITEVFVLSIPFILAMTLPMAVLVAVLYTFSHLAADSEVTALRASGVSVPRILFPVLIWGLAMAAVNFAFVDQVLPRSNARLRSLLIDIGRKKAAFGLKEQVINEVPPSKYFIRATRIDAATGRLKGVTIYDVGGEASRRIIYADSGSMAYAEGQTDLSLRLYDGSIHQYRPAEPTRFQLTYFSINDIRVKNVYDELQRSTSESIRGDREMSTCEMLAVVHEAKEEQQEAREERAELVAQVEDSGGEEIGQRLVDVPQAQQVRDVARALDREEETRRRLAIPVVVVLRTLQRVERAVDLDGGEMPAAELELAAMGQSLGVPDTAPRLVAPAGDADADHASARRT